ncbi:hypothetical protein PN36_27600 [Candidatus Thiomargarita nelsonii]|uniref:Uncharacterized protein n=1 Tax=Candidatus Thiomargarita nelsonii TaxID=1003181 RepID=A0A4E0QZM6_9GAMM|nr:hypothetical protein PN36_27600 [Candidatus Thiomargarita nelsonii]
MLRWLKNTQAGLVLFVVLHWLYSLAKNSLALILIYSVGSMPYRLGQPQGFATAFYVGAILYGCP